MSQRPRVRQTVVGPASANQSQSGVASSSAETVPDRLAPMLAEPVEAPFDSDKHLFEVKWDGTRCVAIIKRGHVRLHNRRFADLAGRYPELVGLRKLPDGTILDGELVVLEAGKPSFSKLQQREHVVDSRRIAILSQRLPATFIVFDIPWLKGKCLIKEPLSRRREALKQVVSELDDPHVVLSEAVSQEGITFFKAVAEMGLEGMVAKRLDSAYLPGQRSTHWLKIKVARTAEFDIAGYVQREGEKTVSALLLCERQGERLVFRAKVGSGFTEAQRREFFRQLADAPALSNPPKDGPKDAVWRKCALRCRVRFFEETADRHLRSPVYIAMVPSATGNSAE